jgi:DNA anti-recombination protein RmuC
MDANLIILLVLLLAVVLAIVAFIVGRKLATPPTDDGKLQLLDQALQEAKQQASTLTTQLQQQADELLQVRSQHAAQESTIASLKEQIETERQHGQSLLEQEKQQSQSLLNQEKQKGQSLLEQEKKTGQSLLEQEKHKNQEQRNELKNSYDTQLQNIRSSYDAQLKSIRETQDKQIQAMKETTQRQFEQQIKTIQEQMQATSERVLKSRQDELGAANNEQVSKIIDPLNKSLRDMAEALEKSKREYTEGITALKTSIDINNQQSTNLQTTAENLTNALKGTVKIQGNFGELTLKQLFDDLGLKDGEQYTSQEMLRDRSGNTIRDDGGRRLIPDYILHFPDHRDVIVDSKMSLKAYLDYLNTDDVDRKAEYLEAHIKSVRNHVEELRRKDYSNYLDTGYNRLNFVIMYMPVEGALNLALANDTALWNEAYRKGVLILGPQTMYMNLRVLETMWRQVRQLKNQQDIITACESILKRVNSFIDRFATVENKFAETSEAIKKVKTSLNGKQGIIGAAHKLLKATQFNPQKYEHLSKAIEDSDLFIEEESDHNVIPDPDEIEALEGPESEREGETSEDDAEE